MTTTSATEVIRTCYNQEIPACAAVRLVAQTGVITSIAVVRDALRTIAKENHSEKTQ